MSKFQRISENPTAWKTRQNTWSEYQTLLIYFIFTQPQFCYFKTSILFDTVNVWIPNIWNLKYAEIRNRCRLDFRQLFGISIWTCPFGLFYSYSPVRIGNFLARWVLIIIKDAAWWGANIKNLWNGQVLPWTKTRGGRRNNLIFYYNKIFFQNQNSVTHFSSCWCLGPSSSTSFSHHSTITIWWDHQLALAFDNKLLDLLN